MSDIRFNNWLHQSGTGGVYQDSSGRVGVGTSVPRTVLDVVGIVSATTFSGNLTGNVSGNLTGNVSGNVSAGVVTATSSIVTNSATIGGNLQVNNILPSIGTNVAIGTAGGSVTLTGSVTGSSIINTGVTTVSAGSASAPSISPTGDSNTGIFFPSADTIAFAEGGVESLRVDSSGRVGINSNSPNDFQVDISAPSDRPPLRIYRQRNTSGGGLLDIRSDVGGTNTREFIFASGGDLTLSTGNLVFGTAGKGIDFSATANSSGTMTSELLSDYEEGTWTPGISGTGGGSYTAGASNVGWYRKIGKIVFVGGTLQWTAQVTPYSGTLTLTGFPFASTTASNARSGGGLGAVSSGLTFTAGYSSWTLVIDPGGNTFGYIIQVATGGSGYSHNPTVGTSGVLYGFFCNYSTD